MGSRKRCTSPSRTSASSRRWNARSVARCPIETIVAPGRRRMQERVERRLRGLVERSRGLVEKQEVGRLQDRAREAKPLLLAG